jgi:tripartite-type tricarboxylate transporter receptor subunit TctC
LLSGRIDFAYTPIPSTIELIRDGRLTPLAVSARTRASSLPNVPTTLESGYRDSDFDFYVGMFAPTKTPKDVIEKLNQGILRVLQSKPMQEKLANVGAEPMIMTSAAFESKVREEIANYSALVKTLGLTPI